MAMAEPVFLRNEYTGAIVRNALGAPVVIGQTPIRPPLSYMATPPMSYASMMPPHLPAYRAGTPIVAPLPPPGLHRPPGYGYSYGYGTGCCAGGLAGIGCCICCDSCCRDCDYCCQDCCYGYW